jgi:aspartate/methionine/tyrosine aminotransferase
VTAPAAAPAALADRMAALSGEGALDVFRRATELERGGRRWCTSSSARPDVDAPPHVVEAAVRALRAGDARYVAPQGPPELREAIADDVRSRGGPCDARQVLVTPSAKTAVFYAMLAAWARATRCSSRPGLPDLPVDGPLRRRRAGGLRARRATRPTSTTWPRASRRARACSCSTRRGTPPAARWARRRSPASPSWPSGTTCRRHRRHLLAARLRRRARAERAGAPARGGRTLLVDGFSKTYAMTGYRLGYLVAPAAWMERLTTLAVNGHTCVPPFIQRAGVAALAGPQDAVAAQVAVYRARRDRLVAALDAVPGVRCAEPRGAFYAFPDFSAALAPRGLTSRAFAARLLEEHGVAGIDGAAFGPRGEGHLRFSFASAQADLDAAAARVRAAVEALGAAAA